VVTKTTNKDPVAKTFRARGRVQGVYFRDSVRQEAERSGVGGWVRNRPDGEVEGLVEGDDTAVSALIEFIREGPGRAQVEELAVGDAEPEGSTEFRIA
jgi:acylphosphatase